MSPANEPLPFHESIIIALQRFGLDPNHHEARNLLLHIQETKIMEGHDAIIFAIDRYITCRHFSRLGCLCDETKESIRKQKEECAAKSETKQRATHNMFEALMSVARLPETYRIRRSDCLKRDYEKYFGNTHAREVFQVLIGEKGEEDISALGQGCYRTVSMMAARDNNALT